MKISNALLAAAVVMTAVAGLSTSTSAAAPKPKPPKSVSTYVCGSELGYLRRVYEEDIDLVEDVSVVPVCENEDYGLMKSDGNAGAIRKHLAHNDAIADALDFANYGVEDVVGVRMTGDESVIIYVHPFHHR